MPARRPGTPTGSPTSPRTPAGPVLTTAPYGGAELGEVDRIGRRLRALADEVEAAGRRLTAAQVNLRACSYLQTAEGFRTPKDAAAAAAYREAVEGIQPFVSLTDRPRIEVVEVLEAALEKLADFGLDGVVHHCQHDYLMLASTTYFDWLAEKLAS